MKNLRRWRLQSHDPYTLTLAADARLSVTDYMDDQVWEVLPGKDGNPALVLQTRYGGRAGLASLVPLWLHENRVVTETQAYAHKPMITAFAPGYARLQASITLQLALQAEYWVMDSHAVGISFTLANAHVEPTTVRFDLMGHVIQQGKEQRLGIITLGDGQNALYMGQIGNLNPVVMMDEGDADTTIGISPKIGREFTIPGRSKVTFRCVHAGLPDMRDALTHAAHWLEQDWDEHFSRIDAAAQAIPDIHTGNDDHDAVIAFSYMQLVQSFLRATGSLPHASFVTTRKTERGYSARGDGRDHGRGWEGQNPTHAYLLALGIAPIAPELAKGVVRNYLATQREDGWVDWQPGLGGQSRGMLCMPILATLAWKIHQYTEDKAFLKDVLPGLIKFYQRWFEPDMDKDGDGFPEWQTEAQTGYAFFPTFAQLQAWGQNADIDTVESPDMLAYIFSEAHHLQSIDIELNLDDVDDSVDDPYLPEQLRNYLDNLDPSTPFPYRDRDTHITAPSVVVLENGRGDEEHILALELDPPNRLIVTIRGGTDRVPRMTLHIEGANADSNPVSETAPADQITWRYGRGVYTTESVFSRVDRLWCEGLIGVFRISAKTVDTTRLDINALLPLWGMPTTLKNSLKYIKRAKEHFLRPNGLTMCSSQDEAFDPSNADGCGGVWLYWFTLVADGAINVGQPELAADACKRLLTAQAAVLKAHKAFTEFYHSDEPIGLGELGHSAGIAPLYLLDKMFNVRIYDSTRVKIGAQFYWGKAVTVKKYGVTVERRADGSAKVTFPSGHIAEVAAGVDEGVTDPTAEGTTQTPSGRLNPAPTPVPQPPEPPTVSINVEHE